MASGASKVAIFWSRMRTLFRSPGRGLVDGVADAVDDEEA